MNRYMSRLVAAGVLATLLLASAQPALAQNAFRIAGVVPLSGAWGIIGESMRRGATIAFEERDNKVLGAPIEVEWHDTETSTQVAVQKTTRALAKETHTVFGEVSSGSTLAMMKLTTQRKVPQIVTLSADDRITGDDKSRYTFRTSNTVAMENRMIGEFAKRQGVKKVYAIVADYQVGRDMWAFLRDDLDSKDIETVDVDLAPVGTKDYAVLLDKALKSSADGLVMIVVGGDVVTALKQGGSVGLAKKMTVMGTMLMDETLGLSVGKEGSLGVNSTLRYHFTQDTPRNKRFVEAYRAKYGEVPSQYAGEAYDGMSWWLDVVESTGVWDKEKWVDAFSGSVRTDSVEGEKRMRTCDNQAEQMGMFGIATVGDDTMPVRMEVTETFSADALFSPCK